MEVSGQLHAMATLPLRKETLNVHKIKSTELTSETFFDAVNACKIECKRMSFEDCMHNPN
jgi:hypothetical protein